MLRVESNKKYPKKEKNRTKVGNIALAAAKRVQEEVVLTTTNKNNQRKKWLDFAHKDDIVWTGSFPLKNSHLTFFKALLRAGRPAGYLSSFSFSIYAMMWFPIAIDE